MRVRDDVTFELDELEVTADFADIKQQYENFLAADDSVCLVDESIVPHLIMSVAMNFPEEWAKFIRQMVFPIINSFYRTINITSIPVSS